MKKSTEDFTVQVDGVKGVCPAGEAWAEQAILQNRIPVFSCEGPCVRGDIARRAADMVAKEEEIAEPERLAVLGRGGDRDHALFHRP